MDDFEKADAEVEVEVEAADIVVTSAKKFRPPAASNMIEHRHNLVREYHGGSSSLVERLEREQKNDMSHLVLALVDEVISETDNLKGNELIATEEGDLRDASIISFKRAEVLEKAIKAVQTKQLFDKGSGVDVNSPSMQVVFRFFMRKVKIVFERMGYDEEACDTFFEHFGTVMDGWQKELQAEIEESDVLVGSRERIGNAS